MRGVCLGSRDGLTPLRTCLIQREHREQQLSEEHGLGQRPADQPWPNELTLQCLSLSICKNRAIQTSFLRCFEMGSWENKEQEILELNTLAC